MSTVYVKKKAPRIVVKVEYDNGEVFELEKQFKWNGMRWAALAYNKGYYKSEEVKPTPSKEVAKPEKVYSIVQNIPS